MICTHGTIDTWCRECVSRSIIERLSGLLLDALEFTASDPSRAEWEHDVLAAIERARELFNPKNVERD